MLGDVGASLDRSLAGTLVLVGAGPWSEFHCTWVKERGGVAVDFGSGFDLLAGAATRPIHHKIDRGALTKEFRSPYSSGRTN